MATAQVSECLALLKEMGREFYSEETKSSHNGLCEVAGVWTPVEVDVRETKSVEYIHTIITPLLHQNFTALSK